MILHHHINFMHVMHAQIHFNCALIVLDRSGQQYIHTRLLCTGIISCLRPWIMVKDDLRLIHGFKGGGTASVDTCIELKSAIIH
jgi:hypothetical protein